MPENERRELRSEREPERYKTHTEMMEFLGEEGARGNSMAEQLYTRYSEDEHREARWRPLVNRDELYQELKDGGFERRSMAEYDHARICLEHMLDATDHELRSNRSYYERIASNVIGEAMTSSSFAAFQKWAFDLVREIWPMMAPLMQMIGLQTMPLPSSRLFYMYSYYTDAGDHYSANARLVNQNDPDYADYDTEGSEASEVHMGITGATVTAVAKALLTRYSRFARQDAAAYHNLSVRGEMSKIMAAQIMREICGEVRDDLRGGGSGSVVTWYTTPAASSIYTLDSAGDARWNETLFHSIEDAQEDIFGKMYRKIGWVWCSPDVATRMNKAGRYEFRPAPKTDKIGGSIGRTTEFFGVVNNQWYVFADPDAAANTCIVGVMPQSWLETGYILATYQPIAYTDEFEDPAELEPRFAAVTRYARHGINWNFYGRVNPTAR